MRRLILALAATLAGPAVAQAATPVLMSNVYALDLDGANVTMNANGMLSLHPPSAAVIISNTAQQIVPSNNAVCYVGDSITYAALASSSVGVTASGGTGPYTFAFSGLPAGFPTPTNQTPSVLLGGGTFTALPGVYSVTITATDSVAATGSRPYTVTVSNNRTVSVVANGSSSGTLALSDNSIVNLYSQNRGAAFWVPFLTGYRTTAPQTLNFSLPGDTTTSLLTRMAPIVAANCGSYVVMIGTNDLGTSVSQAQTQANISSIWSQLLATGRPVIAQPILPRTLTAASASMNELWSLNRWIKQQAGAIPGLYIVDSTAAYGDPLSTTATPRVGATIDYTYSYDGLHPKGVGAYAAFAPVATFFNQLYTDPGPPNTGNSDLYATANPSGNLLANGMMSFVGGTGTVSGKVTGSTPDGWTAFSADAGCTTCSYTGVASSSTLADGTPAAQIVIAGTAAGGYATQVALAYNITTFGNFSVGDKLQATCRVEVSTGSAHVTAPSLQLSYNAGGVLNTLWAGAPLVSDASPPTAYSGTLSTPLPAPPIQGGLSGNLSLWVNAYITNGTSATVAMTYKVGGCALRKV